MSTILINTIPVKSRLNLDSKAKVNDMVRDLLVIFSVSPFGIYTTKVVPAILIRCILYLLLRFNFLRITFLVELA